MEDKSRPKLLIRQLRKIWKTAKAPGVTHFDDDALGFGTLVADEDDPEQRNAAGAQSLYRQETVINRPERRTGTKHHRRAPPGNDVDVSELARQRHQQPAGPLHDQWAARIR